MNKTILGGLGVVFGATLSTLAMADALGHSFDAPSSLATQRRIAGVITALDASSCTIQGKTAVTGRVSDATKVTIDGHAAKPGDLRITENAKGEIGLDDVWTTIVASTK